MSAIRIPTLVGGNQANDVYFNTLAGGVNGKAIALAFPLPAVGAATQLAHNIGTNMGWLTSQYHVIAFVEDVEGWPVSAARIEKASADLAVLILAESLTLPFSGKVTLLFMPTL